MDFSHFHGIWDKHICTILNRCCEVMLFLQMENYIYLPNQLNLLPTNHDFGRWKQNLFDILFLIHPRIIYFKNLVELHLNSRFKLNFSSSTGDECNLKL